MIDYKTIFNKELCYGLLSLANILIWMRVLSILFGGSYEVLAITILFFISLQSILLTKKLPSIETTGKILLGLLLIKSLISIGGYVLGGIGVAIATLLIIGRMIFKALTSDFYKGAINSIQDDFNDLFPKRRSKRK